MNEFKNYNLILIIDKSKPLFEMAKLMNEELDKSLFKELNCRFIYFSQAQSGHRPRIKFDGGTSESDTTQTSPSLIFDKDYNFKVKLASQMNKKKGRLC